MLEQCRICLKEGKLFVKIFGESQSSALCVKIMALANVQVHPDDGLPSTICRKCIKEIDKCTNFIQLMKESDQKLRALRGDQIKEEPFSEIEFLSDSEINSDLDEKIIKIKEEEITESFNDEEDTKIDGKDTNIEVKVEKSEVNVAINNKIVKKYCKKSVKCQCNICGKVLSSGYRLKSHMWTHTGERTFSCSYCNRAFSTKPNLARHLKIHTGEKPYKCMECNAVFRYKASLDTHKRILHSRDSPHQCHLCHKMCHTASHLKYHLRQHTGEKNFECDSCGMAFIDRSHLRQHMISHSSERRHMCSICGLRISRASHLKRHLRNVHNKQKKICNKESGEHGEEKGKVSKYAESGERHTSNASSPASNN